MAALPGRWLAVRLGGIVMRWVRWLCTALALHGSAPASWSLMWPCGIGLAHWDLGAVGSHAWLMVFQRWRCLLAVVSRLVQWGCAERLTFRPCCGGG